MCSYFTELGMAQRKFAQCLGEFQFEYIGDAKTDDEDCIGECGFPSSLHTSKQVEVGKDARMYDKTTFTLVLLLNMKMLSA